MGKKTTKIKQNFLQIKIKNTRIKVLKLIHFSLALVLVLRIFLIHHVNGARYVAFYEKKDNHALIKKAKPRGSIYDRNRQILATNDPISTIIYRFDPQKSDAERMEVAQHLAKLVDIQTHYLSEKELDDLYRQAANLDEDAPVSKAQRDSVDTQTKQAFVFFKRMGEARFGGENTLKFEASEAEIARVSEQIDALPGVEVGTAARRAYPHALGQHDLLGHLSKEGSLPDKHFQQYLANGYAMNDRVGLSSLEFQYENWLRGHKSLHIQRDVFEVDTRFAGYAGADLTLTLDADLSHRIDEILEKKMLEAKKNRPGARYLNEGYVVVTNPLTGEILSLNGVALKADGTVRHQPLGTLYNAFTMGSVVKGATLLTGYGHGLVDYGAVIHDKPMIFSDGSTKGSWSPLGMINDVEALRYSSNVYFMQQAIKLGGDTYVPRSSLNLDLAALATYRQAFEQFGLGSYTGIDLPGEQTGLRTTDLSIAKLLDFVIGQSDTYTTLQLAQYVSTLANGGDRYALQLLKEASIPVGENEALLIHSFEPKLLNTIDLPPEAFARVQEGFRQALQEHGGTGHHVFGQAGYQPAGKTGTAEEFARDENGHLIFTPSGHLIPVHHMTFVGYAPADEPQVAIAVVFPQSELPMHKNPLVLEVADAVFKAYFEMRVPDLDD